MAGLAAERGKDETVMIDATYLKAHRTAISMGLKMGGGWPSDWLDQVRYEHKAARHL